jgi:hypothetical protein
VKRSIATSTAHEKRLRNAFQPARAVSTANLTTTLSQHSSITDIPSATN